MRSGRDGSAFNPTRTKRGLEWATRCDIRAEGPAAAQNGFRRATLRSAIFPSRHIQYTPGPSCLVNL